jgi:DNA polymerase
MSDAKLTIERAKEVLRWWAEAGVEAMLDDAAHDRFAETAESLARRAAAATARVRPPEVPPPAREPPPRAVSPIAVAAPDDAARTAAEAAGAAKTLDELRAALEKFNGCGLKATATQLVFADGAPGASIMLVGEAPGGDEDRIGRPFVGRAGQLLDLMLAAIALDRTKVYIANCVPWRPPGNRTPTPQETQVCLPFIRRQIELSNPEILVCLGGSALSALFGGKESITRARGVWREYAVSDALKIPALPMFHPAYLLRQPNAKRWAWFDLRKLRRAIEAGHRAV